MYAVFVLVVGYIVAAAASAETLDITPQRITEWKPVYGEVATRDRVPARARIGGTVAALGVTEGDQVEAGERIAMIEDDKLQFRIDALDARLDALRARLETAQTDLERGEQLLERGVITTQRLDQLRTEVDVLRGEISSVESERLVIEQQIEEGEVLAPETGVVLKVPVARGSVVTPGEAIAEIGGGGAFLRLAIPERFAADLAEGDRIEIGPGAGGMGLDRRTGELVKLYPLIEGGRVQADVEIEGLDARFVGRRVPVRLPVAERMAILVPDAAIDTRGGLDFVTVESAEGRLARVVVPGAVVERNGTTWREILTGLAAGETVVTPDE
ncbi:efflux transporter periplasmic adaptor subunit [Rhodosalinus halophilus]|uniref:Efflux transporter periplasmic adaptor subunit n=1 Tax=Rhodosalinus halophilus TaxID=2259333 RepID=A0A365U827_9RHOB|nr:efflux RND transporter periplasmic adaptor subunit [Rhodosalinus halophilus]RBI83799.1 efflux transporter periplasmic adaptor subunit [Rhodosalinus halophilus]